MIFSNVTELDQYLSKYRHLNDEYQTITERMMSISSPALSFDGFSQNGGDNRLTYCIERKEMIWEEMMEIQHTVELLCSDYPQLFNLMFRRYIMSQSIAQMAEALGYSCSYVKKRLRVARERLLDLIEERDNEILRAIETVYGEEVK